MTASEVGPFVKTGGLGDVLGTLPQALTEQHTAFVVCLVASVDRIAEIRRNRVRLMSDRNLEDYVDRTYSVSTESVSV